MSKLKFVYSPKYEMDLGPHVFPTEKYRLVYQRIVDEGLATPEDFFHPTLPPFEDLQLVHDEEYLRDLQELRRTPRTLWSELPLTQEIVEGFRWMAGGTWKATELALQYGVGYHIGGGFHHAYPDHAEGFCYINDLAYAIRKGQREGKFQKAIVIDCDVHQGNGTARIFQNDSTVFTFSIHQEQLYPIPKEKSDLDIGLPIGIGDEEYLDRLRQALELISQSFTPEIVFYQAGADPYEDDQLGGLRLSMNGLKQRDQLVFEYALNRWKVPVVVTLGGGYAWNVEDTVAIHVQTAKVAQDVLEVAPWNPSVDVR